MMEFHISGVETYWWLPMLAAFVVSVLTSPAGLSGAFALLPFQVSILRYTTPGVTSTNLLFNVFAIPSGVYRLWREKRMVWPLVWTISLGTIPGLLCGVIIRVRYLPQPGPFKMFVGLVLLYIASRLFLNALGKQSPAANDQNARGKFEVTPLRFDLKTIQYEFNDETYHAPTIILFLVSAVVGAIGGIYGIGGGAILAPFLVTFFRLPVHTISGATLCGTFLTSVVGIIFYLFVAPFFAASPDISASPDWLLGLSLGLGGAAGIYAGSRLQKYLPARLIKIILGIIMFFIAGKYILEFLAK